MSKSLSQMTDISSKNLGYAYKSGVSVIAVGDPARWEKTGQALPSEQIQFFSFREITAELLDHIQPESVFSPVVAQNFDCIELAMTLHNLGFTGAYRAFATNLPKPALIEREVGFICPNLDFKIISAN